jgi:outer membrane protein TolC
VENAPALLESRNLLNIGDLQAERILAENNAWHLNATSEIMVSPYFNNDGKAIAITPNPDPEAIGYDVGITNGGLYSAQLNLTKNLLNQSTVQNLLFQNKVDKESQILNAEETHHLLEKKITDVYILAYLYQLEEAFISTTIADLETRKSIVEILVKRGILPESDYLLIQVDLESRKLELEQIQNNYNTFYIQLGNLCGISVPAFTRLAKPDLQLQKEKDTLFFEKRYMNDSLKIAAEQQVFENRYKPQLLAYGNTGLNAVEIPDMERKFGMSAGVRLTIPIYDGNQRNYATLQNDLKYENLQNYRKNNEIQLENNLKSLKLQISHIKTSLEQLESQLEHQKTLIEIYKGMLVQGQVSIINYLSVIQNFRQMTFTKFQAQTNLWLLYNQLNFTNW